MDDRYLCPKCGSDDVRKVEMIWKEQTGDIMRIRRRELQKTLQCLTPAEHRLVCLATIRRTPWRNLSEENLDPCLQSVWTLSKGSSENEKENGEQWHGGEIGKGASSVVFTKPAVPILGPLAFLSVFWDGGWGIIKLTELFIFLYPCYNLK